MLEDFLSSHSSEGMDSFTPNNSKLHRKSKNWIVLFEKRKRKRESIL
jgi:hypothetical protein